MVEFKGRLNRMFFAIGGNDTRFKIYDMCLNEKLNITQITEKVKISYKSVLNHIRILEEMGLIRRDKQTTEKAQESFITSIPLNEETVYYQFYKDKKMELEQEDINKSY